MAAGHPSNQGMPGGQPGMMAQQLHGMGGPQAGQGPMMNVPHGGPVMAGPSAHAMSHLSPGNMLQQQIQQQHMQHARKYNLTTLSHPPLNLELDIEAPFVP